MVITRRLWIQIDSIIRKNCAFVSILIKFIVHFYSILLVYREHFAHLYGPGGLVEDHEKPIMD